MILLLYRYHLPVSFIPDNSNLIPEDWGQLMHREIIFLDSIKLGELECVEAEERTRAQSNCQEWFDIRKHRITSTQANKILIRKINFETLLEEIVNPKTDDQLPTIVKEALKHGEMYEDTARKLYNRYLKYDLKHDINVRECGIVIQPNLFWLGASPDGLVTDKSHPSIIGLIEIKCPRSKHNSTPEEMLKDQKFYMHYVDGKPELKKSHSNGYYTQIQMAMGLAGVEFCDFIVYTFKGLIIARTSFNEEFFVKLVKKLYSFYKQYIHDTKASVKIF